MPEDKSQPEELQQSETGADTDARADFNESTAPSLDDDGPATEVQEVAAVESPGLTTLGRYQLNPRPLGQGGMGVVYEATHLDDGNQVALKVLPKGAAAALARFKEEFRKLADVSHPNLIGLHHLEMDAARDTWYFTMDLLRGRNFMEYVRPAGELQVDRLRQAMSQLVRGVQALHQQGIVHCDLKPANVMVTDDEQRLVILDFGLVIETDQVQRSITNSNVAGTPEYMSPLQARGERANESCDWYAVGTMLYEALVGRLPFRNDGQLKLLRQKTDNPAPPIFQADLPEDLCSVANRLLDRDPAKRPEVEELSEVFVVDIEQHERTLDSGLVGRERQLNQLNDVFRQVREQRQALNVFVSGLSGEGKTSLIDAFLQQSLQDHPEVTLLAGRCYDRESVPYKALDRVIDSLASKLRSLEDAQVGQLIPDDVEFIGTLFPVIQRVRLFRTFATPQDLQELGEQQIRRRGFRALRSLLRRLSRSAPIIMFIDDLQWGDSDSAEAMFEFLKPPEAPAVLFIGSYRRDEARNSDFLKRWDELLAESETKIEQQSVEVGPLEFGEFIQFATAELGRHTEERAARQLYDETGGNPFLLSEILLQSESDSLQQIPLAQLIEAKLERLSSEARVILNAIAVSGQAMLRSELLDFEGVGSDGVNALIQMRREKLVRTLGTEQLQLVDTYHDKVRETVLAHMDQDRRSALHSTFAQSIMDAHEELNESLIEAVLAGSDDELSSIEWIYDLSYHCAEAGIADQALAFSLLAARQATGQFSLETAIQQYEIAERFVTDARDRVRYCIGRDFGKALLQVGRYEESKQRLAQALELSETPEQRATVQGYQGAVAFRTGEVKACMDQYRKALQNLGFWVPQTLLGFGMAISKEMIKERIPFRRNSSRTVDPNSILRHRLLTGFALGGAWSHTPSFMWGTWKAANDAVRFRPSESLYTTTSIQGVLSACIGLQGQSKRYSARAVEIAEQLDDDRGRGFTLEWRGMCGYVWGLFDDALNDLNRAIEFFEQSGDEWEVNFARFHAACCHYALGNLQESVELTRQTFDSSLRTGDSRTHCSLYMWSRCYDGAIDLHDYERQITGIPEDLLSTSNLHKGQGYRRLHEGDLDGACEVFDRSGAIPLRHRLFNFHTIVCYIDAARAHRLRANASEGWDARRARSRALKYANRATWLARVIPVEYPYALRELSLVHKDMGNLSKAIKLARKSVEVSQKQNARYQLAQSLVAQGQIEKEMGDSAADERIAQANESLVAIRSQLP